MGFFDKIRDFRLKISEVENNIVIGRRDYLEVYERNIQLEQEIQDRTKELNIANKRMLSLQGILDMMNAAKPLQNVLETIVNNLQGDLGYLHSNIMKKCEDENGYYLHVVAQSNDDAIKGVNENLNFAIEEQRLMFEPKGIFAQSLDHKMIIQSKNVKEAMGSVLPEIDEEVIKKASGTMGCRSRRSP